MTDLFFILVDENHVAMDTQHILDCDSGLGPSVGPSPSGRSSHQSDHSSTVISIPHGRYYVHVCACMHVCVRACVCHYWTPKAISIIVESPQGYYNGVPVTPSRAALWSLKATPKNFSTSAESESQLFLSVAGFHLRRGA